jgi:hypothetical protein
MLDHRRRELETDRIGKLLLACGLKKISPSTPDVQHAGILEPTAHYQLADQPAILEDPVRFGVAAEVRLWIAIKHMRIAREGKRVWKEQGAVPAPDDRRDDSHAIALVASSALPQGQLRCRAADRAVDAAKLEAITIAVFCDRRGAR